MLATETSQSGWVKGNGKNKRTNPKAKKEKKFVLTTLCKAVH